MSHINYNEDNPGPGTCWLNYKHVLPQAPIQSIAHRLPIWFDYDKPGPGTYNVRKDGNDSPKYTMAEKDRWFPWNDVPGPETYYVREEVPAEDDMGYTIGRRFTTKDSPTPGPGAYSPKHPSGSPKHTIAQHVSDGSRPSTPGVGAYNLRSREFGGPRYTMGRKFYRLRNMKREHRYSRALKHRPKLAGSQSPARGGFMSSWWTHAPRADFIALNPKPHLLAQSGHAAPEGPHVEFHRKHSTHAHVKPEIPRRASSKFLSPPRTSAIGTQVDLPAPEAPPPPAAPPAEPVVPKPNAWMDVGKRLQRTRDAITAEANLPDPEPPPPPREGEGEALPPR